MTQHKHWSLGAKLALVGTPFLLLALLSTAATLWVSWQLDGGAAAVNEAGRMRMQSYRMALSIGTGETSALPEQVKEFERSMAMLRKGDPERPLFVPWDDTVRARFATVEQDWTHFRAHWIDDRPRVLLDLRVETVAFASHIDAWVNSIEAHMAHWTALLHLLQMSMRGASNKEIAREHGIAETTVKIHVQHVLRKLDVSSRVHAAVMAAEYGLL